MNSKLQLTIVRVNPNDGNSEPLKLLNFDFERMMMVETTPAGMPIRSYSMKEGDECLLIGTNILTLLEFDGYVWEKYLSYITEKSLLR